ncbi:MAG: hypothetical protein E7162_02305 [Firmicutes bacterium]|nr:hypothetical protein [Bacillota bacterium]
MEVFGFMFVWIIFVLFEMFINLFIPFLFFKLIFQAIKRSKNRNYFKSNVVYKEYIDGNSSKYKNDYIDVSSSKLAKFNTDDINLLKDYFYDIFYKFETAYNNLDYNTMKMISTSQLYQNYYTGISLNLKIGQKKVINNIRRKNVIIYELDSTSMKQIASLMIEVSYHKYTLDKHGFVISGKKDVPITEKFEVEFRKDFERKPITNCPNCGAALKGNTCDYCKSKVKDVEFKISSIKKIIS